MPQHAWSVHARSSVASGGAERPRLAMDTASEQGMDVALQPDEQIGTWLSKSASGDVVVGCYPAGGPFARISGRIHATLHSTKLHAGNRVVQRRTLTTLKLMAVVSNASTRQTVALPDAFREPTHGGITASRFPCTSKGRTTTRPTPTLASLPTRSISTEFPVSHALSVFDRDSYRDQSEPCPPPTPPAIKEGHHDLPRAPQTTSRRMTSSPTVAPAPITIAPLAKTINYYLHSHLQTPFAGQQPNSGLEQGSLHYW